MSGGRARPAQIYSRLVASFSESVLAFRVAAVLVDALVALTIAGPLVATGRAWTWLLVYLWHPLVAFETAVGGHVDVLGALAITVSFLAALEAGLRILEVPVQSRQRGQDDRRSPDRSSARCAPACGCWRFSQPCV